MITMTLVAQLVIVLLLVAIFVIHLKMARLNKEFYNIQRDINRITAQRLGRLERRAVREEGITREGTIGSVSCPQQP